MLKLGFIGSFALAATAGGALTIKAYTESFNTARLGVILLLLLFVHMLRYPRVIVCREFALYLAFVSYMVLALLWTSDVALAMNTLEPALDFFLILILIGSLVAYHDLRTVLGGLLCGFSIAAVFYAVTRGFPFVYPEDFSYNSIAGMYLFGLFVTVALSWYTRSIVLGLAMGMLLLLHLAATTSIKANLGILLGACAAGLIYFRYFARLLRGNIFSIIILTIILTFSVASSSALVERIHAGVDRVVLGLEILKVRDDVSGYSGFSEREEWTNVGLKGWEKNPVLGKGVEAFRDAYGITSHSTPVDLLFNFGLVGLLLFYSVFVSLAYRLVRIRDKSSGGLRALILGGLACYVSMSLSGTMYYDSFLAVFVAISAALLGRYRRYSLNPGLSSGPTNVS